MRPRQSSLGIEGLREAIRKEKSCFNEAEAIKPRNRRPPRRRRPGLVASMRPRQSSLGIASSLVGYGFRKRCLAGFNEAEAIKPRNPGSQSGFRSHDPEEVASMRPRQSSLGILTSRYRQLRRPTAPASMRPRQSSLGISEPTVHDYGRAVTALQ